MQKTVVGLLTVLVTYSATAGAQTPSVVAEVDGVAITEEDVTRVIGMTLAKIENQVHQFKLQTIEALVAEKLLAAEGARRNLTTTALLDAEVTSKVSVVTEQEIDTYYAANKAQFANQPEANARAQIRAKLQNDKLAASRRAYIESLRAHANVRVLLKPPAAYRVSIDTSGVRTRGPANAPVTIVEFSDYHCPFCKRAEETITQILARYGDRVRFVFKDFPIDQLHPQARSAHEAARCAADQSRFWEFHTLLFAGTPQSTPQQLQSLAERAGVDRARFDQCVARGAHKAAVQQDVDEGNRLGISATPTFFINGRPISGAQPLETFAQLIDDELATVGRTPPSSTTR